MKTRWARTRVSVLVAWTLGALVGVYLINVNSLGAARASEPGEGRLALKAGDDPAAAFKEMSALVGFDVRMPSYLPAGNRITGLDAIGAHGRAAYVQIYVVGDNGGCLISALREPVASLDGFVASGRADTWMMRTESGTLYYVARAGHAFTLQFRSDSTMTPAEVDGLLSGL